MALFFLLDSVGQNAMKKGKARVVFLVGQCIRSKIRLIIDSPGQVDNLAQIEKVPWLAWVY